MPTLVASLLWLLLLAAVFAGSASDDELIRNTIRVALPFYATALNLMLWLRLADWSAATPRGRLARGCWTLAWAAYVVHVATAFHVAYRWSHAAAVEHTEQVSGFGEGIYMSHLFTLLWTADVLLWWLRPEAYARRSLWVGRTLHGLMLFVVFNGTVVYETGPIRWAGAVMFAELAAMAWWRRSSAFVFRDAS